MDTQQTPQNLELAPVKPQELTRQATDIAGLCRDIVLKSALEIQRRKYVRVEGWLSIATAHGCVASSRDVESIEGGIRAIGELRRVDTGRVITTAEGFVGDDETLWAKRPLYARRAMAQTRAVSRVCRAAFAHVVVLMDAGLSTTPAEEVPDGGFVDAEVLPPEPKDNSRPPHTRAEPDGGPERQPDADWRSVVVPFGKNKGTKLGALSDKSLLWYCENYAVQTEYEKDGKTVQCSEKSIEEQKAFRAALDAAAAEMMQAE